MADARPTFPLPQRYTQRKTEAVQPPDDRTYSAEVTDFSQSPASSQCAHTFPIHAPDYDTTTSLFCQALFQKKSQNSFRNFGDFADLFFHPLHRRKRQKPSPGGVGGRVGARPDVVSVVFPPHPAKINDFCHLLLKEKAWMLPHHQKFSHFGDSSTRNTLYIII